MKYIKSMIVAVSMLYLSNLGFAQKPVLQTSVHFPPEQARSQNNKYSWIIYSDINEVLIADDTKKGIVITSYDNNTLKVKGVFTIDQPTVQDKDADWVKYYFQDNLVTVLYAIHDKKADVFTIYGRILDRNNKLIKTEQVLMQIDAQRWRELGDIIIKQSPDKKSFAIVRHFSENAVFQVAVYNNQLDRLYEKKLTASSTDKVMKVQDIVLNNNSQIAIIAYQTVPRERTRSFAVEEDRNYNIFIVSANTERLDELSTSLGSYKFSNCGGTVYNDSNQSMVFVGFYRNNVNEDEYAVGVNGLCCVKFDAGHKKFNITYSPIEEKIISQYLKDAGASEKAAVRLSGKGYGISHMVLKHILFAPNGFVKVVGQVEYNDANSSSGHLVSQKYNNQIFQFLLDSMNKLQTTSFLPKKQMVTEGKGIEELGHLFLNNSDQTYFIYNDAKENHAEELMRESDYYRYSFIGCDPYISWGKSRLCCIIVDKDGNISKQPLFDSWKQDMMVMISNSFVQGQSSVVVFAKPVDKKDMVLLKISLDK